MDGSLFETCSYFAVVVDQRLRVLNFAQRATAGADVFDAEVVFLCGGQRPQVGDNFLVILRDISGFGDVVLEVVEFAVGQVQFPVTAADALQVEASEEVERFVL